MWLNIWEQKYINNKISHVNDGFDGLSLSEWQVFVRTFLKLIDIDKSSDILDVGVGSGAFLQEIKEFKSLSGIDYSKNAINALKSKINGSFYISEAIIYHLKRTHLI